MKKAILTIAAVPAAFTVTYIAHSFVVFDLSWLAKSTDVGRIFYLMASLVVTAVAWCGIDENIRD